MKKIALLIGLLTMSMMIQVSTSQASVGTKYDPVPEKYFKSAMQVSPPKKGTVEKRAWAVCQVWGRYRCRKALNVAWCEGRLSPWAVNGIYRGTWQFDPYNQKTYGLGRTIWTQTRAALALWKDRHWNPWECAPWPVRR